MTPEWTLIMINLIFLGFAYLWVYPRLDPVTLPAVLWRDAAITLASLLVAGLVFYGTGTEFSVIFFDTNWLVFSFLSFSAMEVPLFFRFAKRHNLDL